MKSVLACKRDQEKMIGFLRESMSCQKKQLGFTLIELMVGLLLGILLVSATINIFITTKQTYTAKENIARTMENANFAFEIMRQVINSAEPGANGVQAASGTELTVGYKGFAGKTDCLGRPAETTSTYFNRFYVDASKKQLFCDVTTDPTTKTETQPLIDNVSAMTIEYGVDTDTNGIVNEYKNEPDSKELDNILSARITLKLITDPNKPSVNQKDIVFTIAMIPRILSKVSL